MRDPIAISADRVMRERQKINTAMMMRSYSDRLTPITFARFMSRDLSRAVLFL